MESPSPTLPTATRQLLRASVVLSLLIAGVLAISTGARATSSDLPFKVTAAPTVYVQDGQTININVDGTAASNPSATTIYEVKANICKADAVVKFDADFWPTTAGKCLLQPLSAGTSTEAVVQPAPGHQFDVDLAYKAGYGTSTYNWGPGSASSTTITCNQANPCKLVVRVSSSDATAIRFVEFPVTYWDGVSATTSSSTSSSSTSSSSTSTTLPEPTFTDVPSDHPFKADIFWLVQNGIASGYPDGTFKPSSPVTRQAVASFLYKLAGKPAFTVPGTATFTDVPTTHPFFKEIEWLADSGVTAGYSDGTFKPTGVVTRQAVASFLYKFANSPAFTPSGTPTFADVGTTHPFRVAIEWLVSEEVTSGYPDDTFRPTNAVSRQAAASFIHKFDTNVES